MKFTVEVCRTAYQYHSFDVEANSQDEAMQAAEDMACDHFFDNDAAADIEAVSVVAFNDDGTKKSETVV